MTRDELVAALRCCEQHKKCEGDCPLIAEFGCIEKAMGRAADLIEHQKRHIEALLKANDSLKYAIARRDKQIEKMSADLLGAENTANQLDATNSGLMSSNMKLAADRKALINELCQYCGKYKYAHEGACDGCKWRDM